MGLLGLHNLVDLAERHPAAMQGLVAAQEERDYPLAASGINISNMLLAMLSIDAAPNSDACLQWSPSSEQWNSDLFAFLCQLSIEGMAHPLEEVYCIAMELLEQTWVLTKASYMDYNFVLKNMRRRMEGLLARRPGTLGEFRVWILAA
jgi:engulfment and cell motility protein 2